MIPVAVVPLIIRFGATYPLDELRRHARCDDCGHRGMDPIDAKLGRRHHRLCALAKALHHHARGIAIEPNRPMHYHGGRPMEWWLEKQPASIQP